MLLLERECTARLLRPEAHMISSVHRIVQSIATLVAGAALGLIFAPKIGAVGIGE